MIKIIFSLLLLIPINIGSLTYGKVNVTIQSGSSNLITQDTLQEKQFLYKGLIWTNKYRRIQNHQFLFSDMFIPGTVSTAGRTFTNLRLKYDIYSDELITPINLQEIIQLNKEMIDSFSIIFENKIYVFANISQDSLNGLTGFVNVIYNSKSYLYVKYSKNITPSSSTQYDGTFNQALKIFFRKGNDIYLIKNVNDLLKILIKERDQLNNFIKTNKLNISRKNPVSFVPVIRYYDTLRQ